jgi:hypothetical protein
VCQVVIPIGNPPKKGKCDVCGTKTEGWDNKWIGLCPKHWLELDRRIRGG